MTGSIWVDGLDLLTMSLSYRSRFSLIPQQPVLLSGTVRYNIDPLDHYSDSQVIKALDEVCLKSWLSALPQGINNKLESSSMSAGEQQLLMFARILLKTSLLVVMDEATSALDPQTEARLQSVTAACLEKTTLLRIAHRLNTVMDSDKILALDAGTVAEFDSPARLLSSRPSGVFASLVQASKSHHV